MSDIVITIKIPRRSLSVSVEDITPQAFEELKKVIRDGLNNSGLINHTAHIVVDGIYRGLTDHGN
ncbi:MAG: hypothetical protein HYW78_01420 [Parcubacteria group bacterium]|nr:hypothetical protein [Parcubacteria group bacterium]